MEQLHTPSGMHSPLGYEQLLRQVTAMIYTSKIQLVSFRVVSKGWNIHNFEK
jgi:hypothetical protein